MSEEDSELECCLVARQVAGVSLLESDSLPETPAASRSTRKKRKNRRRVVTHMEVDLTPRTGVSTCGMAMEWDCEGGGGEGGEGDSSCAPSDDDGASSLGSRSSDGREADDEQSDWVGYASANRHEQSTRRGSVSGAAARVGGGGGGGGDGAMGAPSTSQGGGGAVGCRRARRSRHSPSSMSSLHRKLEKFSREDGSSELILQLRQPDRIAGLRFTRLLQLYKLEIHRKIRAGVVLRKRSANNTH